MRRSLVRQGLAAAATAAVVAGGRAASLGCGGLGVGVHPQRGRLLLDLGRDLVRATLVCRPSKRNRSPYVADVRLGDGRVAVAHVPSMEMGGKCVPGAELLLRPARDNKGVLVGSEAVSAKYGTPKCEFIAQLLRVDESSMDGPTLWIGAHPSLGEKIANELVEQDLLAPLLPPTSAVAREVRNPAGCDMRSDFVLTPTGPGRRVVVEVKTVVDTDYAAASAPQRDTCVFVSHEVPYQRAGIFPWGTARQKGPAGEKVVSARAIKHVNELAAIARGEKLEAEAERLDAAVVFIVVRHDAVTFRPNVDACPSLAEHLVDAQEAGVAVVAVRCRWGEAEEDLGKCFFDGCIPTCMPSAESIAESRVRLAPKPRKKGQAKKKVKAEGTRKETAALEENGAEETTTASASPTIGDAVAETQVPDVNGAPVKPEGISAKPARKLRTRAKRKRGSRTEEGEDGNAPKSETPASIEAKPRRRSPRRALES